MTTSTRMNKDRSHMTERILDLTLEIIYLLTGESFPPVKSGDQVTITVPPPYSLRLERHNYEKILEVTQKMMEVLTGKVPIRCQDVSVYLSMEEWEYLEGHKDLYKDLIMEEHLTLLSPDGSRDLPQRCPRPLDSSQEPQEIPQKDQEVPQEGQEVPQEDQGGSFMIVKEENEKDDVINEMPDGHKDLLVESSYSRNLPQRSSLDSTQEPPTIPPHHQGEDVMEIKVEDEDDEASGGEEQRYTEGGEPGTRRSFIEDTPTPLNTVHVRKRKRTSEEHLTWPPDWKVEDEDITWSGPGEDLPSPPTPHGAKAPTHYSGEPPTGKGRDLLQSSAGEDFFIYQVPHSENGLSPSCFSKRPPSGRDGDLHQTDKRFSCPECGKSFRFQSSLFAHKRSHTGEKPYSCPECGKSYQLKSTLVRHQKSHTGEKPYSCGECGKSFLQKSHLSVHQICHTKEKPYSCLECGKCYTQKSQLVIHQRSHSGERPYSCTECGKSFSRKFSLCVHEKCHTGEKPYSCSECGKGFSRKSYLYTHQKSHTGEKPYSCPECGKCFSRKSILTVHQICHTRKSELEVHHTGGGAVSMTRAQEIF